MNWQERIHCRGGYTVGMDTLKGGRNECIMHCNRGCTGGQDTPGEGDALEGRMNWEERIHWNGEGCTARVKDALKGGRTEMRYALKSRMRWRGGC